MLCSSTWGTSDEIILSSEEADSLLGHRVDSSTAIVLDNAEQLRLSVELASIGLACARDCCFPEIPIESPFIDKYTLKADLHD